MRSVKSLGGVVAQNPVNWFEVAVKDLTRAERVFQLTHRQLPAEFPALLSLDRAKHNLPLSSPRVAQLDLAYHDIQRTRGLYYLMQRRGLVDRITNDLTVFEAKNVPPQTTRAKLRGDFIRRAQERRRDFTVDWVHLKLNDQAQRTVLCKDPYRSVDDRVEKLINSM